MVPTQPTLSPAGVLFDEVAQCVAGFAGLADGLYLVNSVAALLAPIGAVVPHLPAFDLDADDACTLDSDDEVDLMILEAVGNALAGDDEVVLAELLGEGLPDGALGAVGEAGVVGEGDSHQARVSDPCAGR